jgi:hypothetical protein
VPEFQRDHAAADEDHGAGQFTFAEHLVRCDHELRARNRQWSRLRSRRNHNVSGFEFAVSNADGIRTSECGMALDDLDIALGHRAGEVRGDVLDHVLLAVDQRRPVELRLADGDVMNGCALDFVQRVAGGDQDLLRRAAAVRAGTAEKIGLDHRDRHPGAPDRAGDADAGVAAAQNDHVEFLRCHRIHPSVGNP